MCVYLLCLSNAELLVTLMFVCFDGLLSAFADLFVCRVELGVAVDCVVCFLLFLFFPWYWWVRFCFVVACVIMLLGRVYTVRICFAL